MKSKIYMGIIAGILLALVMNFSAYADDNISPPTPPGNSTGGYLNMYLPHTANNVGSPVTIKINGTPLQQNVSEYSIDFGDGTAWAAAFLRPHPVGALNFSYKYSHNNYFGYNVVFSVSMSGSENASGVVHVTNQRVPIWIAGDANGDGIVNTYDAALVRNHFGARYGTSNYNDGADLNNDNIVDLQDMKIVQENMMYSIYK